MNSDFESALKRVVKHAVREVADEFSDELRALISRLVPRASPNEDGFLLTSREAAKRLAISARHLFELTRTGQLPCVRVGRNVRYRVETIQKWVRDTEATDQSPALQKDDYKRRKTKLVASATPPRKRNRPRQRKAERPRAATVTSPSSLSNTRRQSPSGENRRESEREPQLSPLTVLLSQNGIDTSKLPPITNGELMRIAEVDIATLHGWNYHNQPLPEEATTKLTNHFHRFVSAQPDVV